MSVYKKISTNNEENQNKTHILRLKNENKDLSEELNRINSLVAKLKSEIEKNEQERNKLISNNKTNSKNLEKIMETFETAYLELNQLKSKELELHLKNQQKSSISKKKYKKYLTTNNNNNNNNNNANPMISNLQKKITDLELKLKQTEQKYFTNLSERKSTTLELYSKNFISNTNSEKNKNKNKNHNENIIKTHITKLFEIKNKNKKLEENIKKLKDDYANIEKEKNNLKNKLHILLNDSMKKDGNENSMIKNHLNMIQDNCNALLKKKALLEDKVIRKEDKVIELNKSMNEIMKIMNKKEDQIKQDKKYINNLRDLLSDLKNKYNSNNHNNLNNIISKPLISMQYNYPRKDLNKNNSSDKNTNTLTKIKNFSIINLYRNNGNVYDGNSKYLSLKDRSSLEEKNGSKTLITNGFNLPPYIIKNYLYKNNNFIKNRNNESQNNKSLPDVKEYKRKKLLRKIVLADGKKKSVKSRIIKNNSFSLLDLPKNTNRNNDNSPMRKLYEKYVNNYKKEEYEKKKIEEVKELFDKIVSDFDT